MLPYGWHNAFYPMSCFFGQIATTWRELRIYGTKVSWNYNLLLNVVRV